MTDSNDTNDFDFLPDRRHSNSMKWSAARRLTPEQAAADPLPMWVADMDFRVAEPIRRALHEAVDFGVFGYGSIPTSFLEAVASWQKRRFGWDISHEWVLQTPGVVSAINMAIHAFTNPGDFVLIQTPVYVHFHYDVQINGRRLAQAPLHYDGERYRFDADAFEAAIQPGTKLFILCNPHNPTGNVWSRDELITMGEICARHGVLVLSDEVHQDIILDETKRHVAFGTLGPAFANNCIVATAPSKTFNIAGLQCSNMIIPNKRIREQFRRQCERSGINLVNQMGVVACEAAYRHGEPWLESLVGYLRENQRLFAQSINAMDVGLKVLPAESTYLAWMDCRALRMSDAELQDVLLRKARVWFDVGPKFGQGGQGFMRVNLGCPRSLVNEAIARIGDAFRRN